MVLKNNVSWNDKYQNDGFLYFVQRIIEMLDYTTIDIYRAPLMNTPRLIHEYLKIYNGAAKRYHLEEVYNELKVSFENDIILQYKLGEKRVLQLLSELNKSEDKVKIIEYLRHSLCVDYLDWCKKYIKEIVPQNKFKNKIERAIRCLLPELFRYGYKRDEIYHYAREVLIKNEDASNLLDLFLGRYNCKQKEYTVYLGISHELMKFKDVIENRIGYSFDEDVNINKLELRDGYTVVKSKTLNAIDASMAAEKALRNITLFTMFFQYFGNYSEDFVQRKAVVISSDGDERYLVINRGKFKSIEADNTPLTGKLSELIITGILKDSRCSMNKLSQILKLHNNAISNNGLENGLLNFWSILEITCVEDPEASKIQQVINNLVPVLERDYIPGVFNYIAANLKKILSADKYKATLDSIEEDVSDGQKIALLTLLSKYDKKLDEFVDDLVQYPVIRSRLLNIHDSYSKSKKEFYNQISKYSQRISWHMYRIYRARNAIAHNGNEPLDLKDLGEHLHTYVDCLINELVVKLSISTLCDISNVLVDSRIQLESINKYLKEDKEFDYESIDYIFSAQMECWHT